MLKRVSEEKKVDWIDDSSRFGRDSVNKGAMDSFAKVVTDQANKLKASGVSDKEIAAKFNIKEDVLKDMMGAKSAVCNLPQADRDAEKKHAATEYDKFLDEAEQARKELHGIKERGMPNLPNTSSKRILSGKGLDMTDFGGARKQMGYERNNSIFDTDVIKRQAIEQGNDERIRADNAAIAKRREDIKNIQRHETIDLEKALKANQGDGRGVFQAAQQEAHNYMAKLPSKGISIFDDGAFDRVAEKTAGERRRDAIAKEAAKPKDRSWVDRGAKAVNSKDIISAMVESMLNGGKKE